MQRSPRRRLTSHSPLSSIGTADPAVSLSTLLAIDSATDALSLALLRGGARRAVHRVMPRQHQQQLFRSLEELLDGQAPADLGLDAIVFGQGPGSFTGLRIAASAAQGLGFSLCVPVIGVSTLETQARTLLRTEGLREPCVLLSTIDARIGQVYAAFFRFDGVRLETIGHAVVAKPEALTVPEDLLDPAVPFVGVGSGYQLAQAMPAALAAPNILRPDLLPEAQDMFEPALESLGRSGAGAPAEAIPDYVQTRIGWKTLAEQGRTA